LAFERKRKFATGDSATCTTRVS